MSLFPLYVDLKNKKVLIVGGGKIALGKIKALLPFEPQITVVSPEGREALCELARAHKLTWNRKTYEKEDLEGAYLVIAATSDVPVNERIYNDSILKGLLINVVDDPEKCTFIFPSIVKREDLVIGISTSGKYPALSKALRKKLEAHYPQVYGDLLNRLSVFRDKIMVTVSEPNERKAILTRVVNKLLSQEEIPSLERLEELICIETVTNKV